MSLLSVSRTRQLQRTIKNLRVSLLCFLLTFLVLRNTIGAGKFGTPAQDFEEIRQHLQHVSLHRKHARVLTEVVDEDSPSQSLEEKHKNSPLWATSHLKEVPETNLVPFTHLQASSRDIGGDEQRRVKASQRSSYGDHSVLLVTGSTSPFCKNPQGERFLLKSLRNKLDYSKIYGFDVFYGNGDLKITNGKDISRASLLHALMKTHPHVDWLWWVNTAVVITDMDFELPLLNYTGFDFVLLGSSDDTSYHHGNLISIHTDSFLIRNSQWSLDLLQNWTQIATSNSEDWDQKLELETTKLFVEKTSVARSYWQSMTEKYDKILREARFLTHLVGCNPCGEAEDMEAEICLKHMEKVVDVTENQVIQSHDFKPKRSSSSA